MKWFRPILLAVLLVLAAAGAWLLAVLGQSYRGFGSEGVFIDVPRGASARAIAAQLEAAGVVRSRLAFEILCRWHSGHPLQAGEYKFDRPRSSFEVFEMLAAGRVYQEPLVVPEGMTMFEIATLVEQAGFGTEKDFLDAAADASLIHDLAPRARDMEGFLFPASYQFPRRTAVRELVQAMVRRFREEWASLPDTTVGAMSPIEVVTLASLVERETGTGEERPLIAGVFHNRLRRGMALECDPTVIYALQLAGQYHGTLLRKDLRFRSPYNTYLHRGLPPGPIANPGAAALRAALVPAETDYLYFVANGQGGHFFSRTLTEHNANVARYRRLQAESTRVEGTSSKPNGERSRKAGPGGR